MRKNYYVFAIISVIASLFFAISPQAYALSSCAKTFQDLSSTDAIYIPAIGCLNQKYCVVSGTQDGYLLASTQVNRGEAIAFVTRYHIEVLQDGWKDVNVASLPQYFSDVSPSYGLYKEIEIARNQGFTLGYQDGTFNPTGAWTAGYQGPNRSDYNFSLVPADQQTRGGFLKSMYEKSPQYCSAPTLCSDQNTGTPPRPNGMCSNNFGCKKAQSFYSSTPDCNTPIQQPTYVQDNSCGPVAGGDNSACPAATPTPIAAPLSCPDICSRNYGCTKTGTYTVSNNDCNTTPIFVQAPTYYSNASTASCGTVVTDPATGAKDINDPKNAACRALTPTPAAATPTTAPSDGTTCSDIANANGYVKMAYTPTATGTYTVWTRMIGASATSSIYLQIGNQCNVIVGGAGISTTNWQWVNYRDGNAASKITVALEQGKTYTIHVAGRDSGVKVDLVKLDNTGCAQLEGIDGHCAPAPTNTPIPVQPTSTPTPAQPTNTPVPPTATPTLQPTATPTPTVALPTNTPAPTNTPIPNGTSLDMQFILHAIGAGGDNSNQSGGGGNQNPIDAQRDVTVQVYNTANQLILEKTGKITFYNPQIGIPEITIGSFHGIIDLGTSVTTGDYIVKVKTPFYLRKAFPITQHIVSGEVNQISPLTLVAGDIDNNNQIDLFDYQILSNCYGDFTTPNPALCSAAQKKAADINNDGNVNYIDLNYFIRELAVQAGDITQ